MGALAFVIVCDGRPIFSEELSGFRAFGSRRHSAATGANNKDSGASVAKENDSRHLHQFVLHASLDVVSSHVWSSSAMHLKVVDSFNDMLVSAWRSAGGAMFLLLHEQQDDEGAKSFFRDVHDAYVCASLNPFFRRDAQLTSGSFNARVRAAAKRHL